MGVFFNRQPTGQPPATSAAKPYGGIDYQAATGPTGWDMEVRRAGFTGFVSELRQIVSGTPQRHPLSEMPHRPYSAWQNLTWRWAVRTDQIRALIKKRITS